MTEQAPSQQALQNTASPPRLYQCRMCGRSFMKNEHLVRHVRSHTRERPFRCPDCGNRYSRRDILIRHRRDVQCIHPYLKQINTVVEQPTITTSTESASIPSEHMTAPSEAQLASPAPPTGFERTIECNSDPLAMLSAAAFQHARQPTSADSTLVPASEPGANPSHAAFWPHPAALSGSTQPGPPSLCSPPLCTAPAQVPLFPPNLVDFSDTFPLWNINADLHDDFLEMEFSSFDENLISEVQFTAPLDVELMQMQQVRYVWLAQGPETPNSAVYPERILEPPSIRNSVPGSPVGANNDIDDRYRRKLQKRLRILSSEPTIPSADLLNVWIRLYFTKVHPVFPIIHAATFRPSRANASLLIAMCSMGSLFTGSEQGLRHGIHLFERSHKAMLLKWEQLVARNEDTLTSIIQCVLISQMFGMLSGNPNLLLTVDAFHGPPIAWARHMNLHKARPLINVDPDATGAQLDQVWREWARNEELVLLAHGLYIIDAELASILHREPFQSFRSYTFTFSCSYRVFVATTALDWKARYLTEMQERGNRPSSPDCDLLLPGPLGLCQVPVTSSCTAYVVLEGIGMQAISRRSNTGTKSLKDFQRALSEFHLRFFTRAALANHDQLQLRILWHMVYMSLFADFDLLEKAIGREGCKLSASEFDAVTTWGNSEDARICLHHGLMIKKYVQETSVMSELAMHVPRAMFWAGVAVYCYKKFGPNNHSSKVQQTTPYFNPQGLSIISRDEQTSLANTLEPGTDDSTSLKTTLFALTDLLQHVGHWENARRFAAILTTVSNFGVDHGSSRT